MIHHLDWLNKDTKVRYLAVDLISFLDTRYDLVVCGGSKGNGKMVGLNDLADPFQSYESIYEFFYSLFLFLANCR